MIAVRRSGSSMAPIGSWTADATCSEGHVVSRGGLRGGGGGGGTRAGTSVWWAC